MFNLVDYLAIILKKRLSNVPFQIIFKRGAKADINTTVTKAKGMLGEPHYTHDTKEFYIHNGTKNVLANQAKYSDYSLTQTGNLPTTQAKLDFSGATLVNESQDLFDTTNSRILKMEEDTVGKAIVTMELNTSSGSNHWVELQLKAYDNTDTLLFSKRPKTVAITKNSANDALHTDMEFYFGADVEYFEIHIRANSAIPYTDPAITVIKL